MIACALRKSPQVNTVRPATLLAALAIGENTTAGVRRALTPRNVAAAGLEKALSDA